MIHAIGFLCLRVVSYFFQEAVHGSMQESVLYPYGLVIDYGEGIK